MIFNSTAVKSINKNENENENIIYVPYLQHYHIGNIINKIIPVNCAGREYWYTSTGQDNMIFLNRYSCPGFLEFINSEKEYNNQISSKEKKKISNKDNRKN